MWQLLWAPEELAAAADIDCTKRHYYTDKKNKGSDAGCFYKGFVSTLAQIYLFAKFSLIKQKNVQIKET